MSEIDQIRENLYAKGLYPDVAGIIVNYIRQPCLHLLDNFIEKQTIEVEFPKDEYKTGQPRIPNCRRVLWERTTQYRRKGQRIRKEEWIWTHYWNINVFKLFHIKPGFCYVSDSGVKSTNDLAQDEVKRTSDYNNLEIGRSRYRRPWEEQLVDAKTDPHSVVKIETNGTVLESPFPIYKRRISYPFRNFFQGIEEPTYTYVYWQFYGDGQTVDIMSEFLNYAPICIQGRDQSMKKLDYHLEIVLKTVRLLNKCKMRTYVSLNVLSGMWGVVLVASEKTKEQILLSRTSFRCDIEVGSVIIRNDNPKISAADLKALKTNC
jgi:hypothetical protein